MPHCFYYYSFVRYFKLRQCNASCFVLFVQDCLGYSQSLAVPHILGFNSSAENVTNSNSENPTVCHEPNVCAPQHSSRNPSPKDFRRQSLGEDGTLMDGITKSHRKLSSSSQPRSAHGEASSLQPRRRSSSEPDLADPELFFRSDSASSTLSQQLKLS